MITQVLHCRFRDDNDKAEVYDIEENLKIADLEKIAQNRYPVSIIMTAKESPSTEVYSPVIIKIDILPVGVRVVFASVAPGQSVSSYNLIATTGSVIMKTYSSFTDLDPDLVYLVSVIGGE